MAKNPNLKRAFETSEFTGVRVLELQKCMDDPIYFMENYVKVVHPIHGSVPFVLYDYQKEMVKAIHENRSTVLLCSRQLGKCTSAGTVLCTITPPTGFRKLVLKFLDRCTYDNLYSTVKE